MEDCYNDRYNMCDTQTVNDLFSLDEICTKNYSMKAEAENNSVTYKVKDSTKLYKIHEAMQQTMCKGLGSRRIKLFLGKKAKSNELMAAILKVALDIETLSAIVDRYEDRMCHRYYSWNYEKIMACMYRLLEYIQMYNKDNPYNMINVGYNHANAASYAHIIYIELPFCETIAYEVNMDCETLSSIKQYDKEWDGSINMNFYRIETAIYNIYKKELSEKIHKNEQKKKKQDHTAVINTLF